MANRDDKNAGNAPGAFYVDSTCTDCDLCRANAPQTFRRNDEGGFSIAHQQPETPKEMEDAIYAMNECPTESIGDDG